MNSAILLEIWELVSRPDKTEHASNADSLRLSMGSSNASKHSFNSANTLLCSTAESAIFVRKICIGSSEKLHYTSGPGQQESKTALISHFWALGQGQGPGWLFLRNSCDSSLERSREAERVTNGVCINMSEGDWTQYWCKILNYTQPNQPTNRTQPNQIQKYLSFFPIHLSHPLPQHQIGERQICDKWCVS